MDSLKPLFVVACYFVISSFGIAINESQVLSQMLRDIDMEQKHNFGKVYSNKLLRSAAPSKEFLEYLQRTYKLTAIMDLRNPNSWNEKPQILREKKWAEELGLKYENLKTTSGQALARANTAREKIKDNVVLVHCQEGMDRTGILVAYLRMQDGWSYEEALEEMLSFGHEPETLPTYHSKLKKFYEEKIRSLPKQRGDFFCILNRDKTLTFTIKSSIIYTDIETRKGSL